MQILESDSQLIFDGERKGSSVPYIPEAYLVGISPLSFVCRN